MGDLTTTRNVEGEIVGTVDLEEEDAFDEAILRVEGEQSGFTVDSSDEPGTYILVRKVDE